MAISPTDRPRRKKTVSIFSAINGSMTLTIVPVVVLFGILNILIVHNVTQRFIKRSIDTETQIAADRVSWAVKSYKNIVQGLGTMPFLANDEIPVEDKEVFLNEKSCEYNLVRSQIIDQNGTSVMDRIYRGDREYFKSAIKGQVVISDPIISKSDYQIALVVAAPLWEDGVYNSSIKGVVWSSLNPSVLNTLVSNLVISRNTKAYIISADGTVVASTIPNEVLDMHNSINMSYYLPKYKKIADFERAFLGGQTGVIKYNEGLRTIFAASYPIAEVDGWHMIIQSPAHDFMFGFYVINLITIIITVLSLIFVRFHAKILARRISAPVDYLANRLKKAADGDFTTTVHTLGNNLVEIKKITEATKRLVVRMNMALNGNELYMNKLALSDIIELSVMEELIRKERKENHIGIRLLDLEGEVVAGSHLMDMSGTVFTEKIIMGGRTYGIMEVVPYAGCDLSNEQIQSILTSIIQLMSLFGNTTIQNNLAYKMWKDNELVNLRHLFDSNENLARKLDDWVNELTKSNHSNGKKINNADMLMIAAQAKEIINDLSESSDFARISSANVIERDTEYSLTELADILKRSVNIAYMNEEIDSKVNVVCLEEDRIFGNRHKVETITQNLINTLCAEKIQEIEVRISHERHIYSDNVIVAVSVANEGLIADEIDKFQLWTHRSLNLDEKYLNFFEQRIIAVLKSCAQNGGTHGFSVINGRVQITLKFPQIIVPESSEDN